MICWKSGRQTLSVFEKPSQIRILLTRGHFEGIMMDILACKRELNVFLLFSAIIIALGIH